MTSTIQHNSAIQKDNVLSAIENYSLEELEANLARLYLNQTGANYGNSEFLTRITSNASETVTKEIVQTIFGGERDRVDFQSILRVFELAVPESERELNGVYYTPDEIIRYIVEECVHGDQKICDCACGAGAFLIKATEHIHELTEKDFRDIIRDNIYGVDILEENVRESKVLLSLLAAKNGETVEEEDFNLIQGDSLQLDWEKIFPKVSNGKFDAVIGNPPYINIQTMGESTKQEVRQNYEAVQSGNFNVYTPFIELGINITHNDGRVGYILPRNYFTTLTGESLREFLEENKLVSKIVDFGDKLVFSDALTYTAITLFDKQSKSSLDYLQVDDIKDITSIDSSQFIEINYSTLDPKKWRLLDDNEFKNIREIESHRRLDKIAGIHTGIATLKDDIYIINTSDPESEYYTTQLEGETYSIESGITEELVKISTIEKQAELEENNKRIIVPYKTQLQQTLAGGEKNASREIIPEPELKSKYPKAHEYLVAAQDILATREKGSGASYSPWYKYGRKQGLEYVGERLYTPTYSSGPKFLHHENEYALFSNGYAVFPKKIDIDILKKVLNSKIMDYYIRNTSKEIQGDYQCYQKNFIKSFSIPSFTSKEKQMLEDLDSQKQIDKFLASKYELDLEVAKI